MALENIANQFSGLDMGALIGGPLTSACDAQMKLAMSTVDFIQKVGFYNDKGVSKTRVADFSFERTVINGQDELGNPIYDKEEVKMAIPLLAIVNIPSLMVQSVDVSFDMEVSSSESSESGTDAEASMSAGASGGWGGFSASVSISGKVATHTANTRKSDNSAKYHVEVHAAQAGTPEGLSRVLDIIAASVAPSTVESPQAKQDKKIMEQLKPSIEKKKQLNKKLELKRLEAENLKKELAVFQKQDEQAISSVKQTNFSDDEINNAISDELSK